MSTKEISETQGEVKGTPKKRKRGLGAFYMEKTALALKKYSNIQKMVVLLQGGGALVMQAEI